MQGSEGDPGGNGPTPFDWLPDELEGRVVWVVCAIGRRDMGHLYTLMDCAKEAGVSQCFVHGILDGEDVPSGAWDR